MFMNQEQINRLFDRLDASQIVPSRILSQTQADVISDCLMKCTTYALLHNNLHIFLKYVSTNQFKLKE